MLIKKIVIPFVIVAASVAAIAITYYSNRLDTMLEANIEALSHDEVQSCPDPYDVKNYALGFTIHEGRFSVDVNGEVTILGKKVKVGGFAVGTTVTVTFRLGQCSMYAPGNCCPNSRNGEIEIISVI